MGKLSVHKSISVGDKFGRWVVLAESATRLVGRDLRAQRAFECRCDCGTLRSVIGLSLSNGKSQSCGCLQREVSREKHTVHGATTGRGMTPEYSAWKAIIARCENPKNKRFLDYGGRGIKITAEWRNNFQKFLTDMGPKPGPGYSIDRRDNDADYEPGNCRWATSRQQMVNRRNTRMVNTTRGMRPLADLAKECGVPANTLRARLELGWSLSDAMATPVRAKAPNGTAKYQRRR